MELDVMDPSQEIILDQVLNWVAISEVPDNAAPP